MHKHLRTHMLRPIKPDKIYHTILAKNLKRVPANGLASPHLKKYILFLIDYFKVRGVKCPLQTNTFSNVTFC